MERQNLSDFVPHDFSILNSNRFALARNGSAKSVFPGKQSKRKRSPSSKSTRVLLVGLLRELALYRAEVLRNHGFHVHIPETVDQAYAIIERGDFDVAVLSYTLPSSAVEDLAEQVREHCADCPIIAISETERLDRRISPDAVALAAQGPPALIAALKQVLRRN